MRRKWTEDEDRALFNQWGRVHPSKIARALKRTEASVTRRAYRVVGVKLMNERKTNRKKLYAYPKLHR